MPREADNMMPRLGPPKLLRRVPKLTTAELVRRADKPTRDRSKRCAVRSIKLAQTPKHKFIEPESVIYRVRVYNKDNKNTSTVTVFFPKGRYGARQKPRVNCSCADFVYKSEHALAKKYGNAYLWRSINQLPVIKNPRSLPLLCKHSLLALKALNRRNKSKSLPKKANSRSTKIKLI